MKLIKTRGKGEGETLEDGKCTLKVPLENVFYSRTNRQRVKTRIFCQFVSQKILNAFSWLFEPMKLNALFSERKHLVLAFRQRERLPYDSFETKGKWRVKKCSSFTNEASAFKCVSSFWLASDAMPHLSSCHLIWGEEKAVGNCNSISFSLFFSQKLFTGCYAQPKLENGRRTAKGKLN